MIPLGVLASGYVVAPPPQLEVAYIERYAATSNIPLTVAIGAADATRTVVVVTGLAYAPAGDRPAATLNGTAMSEDLYNPSPGGTARISVFSMAVPTGTTATLNLDIGGQVAIYRIVGAPTVVAHQVSTRTTSATAFGVAGGVTIACGTNASRAHFVDITEDRYFNYSGTHVVLFGHAYTVGSFSVTHGGSSYLATSAITYAPA